MKIKSYLLILAALFSFATIMSCSDSDADCHECHIAFDGPNGEIEVEIGEFCGAALEEVEAPGYTHELTEDVIIGNDTIPAGTYSEIHCEEHAHDH